MAIKNVKHRTWKEFGHRMKYNYTENQKLFYDAIKKLRQKKTQTKELKEQNWRYTKRRKRYFGKMEVIHLKNYRYPNTYRNMIDRVNKQK